MSAVMSAWPVILWLLPVLVAASLLWLGLRHDRRALSQLLLLLACALAAALLMEFFTFMAARMAGPGQAQRVPSLGEGTLQLLRTVAEPRSLTAPLGSLASTAALGVPLAYLWLACVWALHLRGGAPRGPARKPAKARKPAAARPAKK